MQDLVKDAPETTQAGSDNIVDVLGFMMGDLKVDVMVSAKIGGPVASWNKGRYTHLPLTIDASTGVIQLPAAHSWKGVQSRTSANNNMNLVRAFTLQIQFPEQADRFVRCAQRNANNEYQGMGNYAVTKEGMRHYTVRDIGILSSTRTAEMQEFEGAPPLLVYTANKNQDLTSNRLDIIIMDRYGFTEVWQLTLQTYDDGETFRLIAGQQLEGEWQRLPKPSLYQPTGNPEVFLHPNIKELVNKLIFLPSAGFPGFDQKAQLLLLPEFRAALESLMASFEVWKGEERNFDLKLVDLVQFRNPKQGVVKFWDRSAAGGYGIVERLDACGKIRAYHFKYRSFTEDAEFGAFGDPVITRGDYVTWTDELAVPNKPGTNQPMPPLVRGLVVVHQTML